MPTSYNGWTASKDPGAINVMRFAVPEIDAKISLTIRKEVAPVLLALAADFHRDVDRLDNKVGDDWGYAYREIRGGGPLSCHASGTAIDLNATRYPMGRSNMTAKQVAAVRRLLAKYEVVRWGGDFSGDRVDQMHFEIAPGKTLADVRAVIHRLGLNADGSTEAVPEYPGHVLRKGDKGPAVKAVQRGLGVAVTGVFNDETASAVFRWKSRRPRFFPPNSGVGRRAYEAITAR